MDRSSAGMQSTPKIPTNLKTRPLFLILAIACEPPEASGRPVSHWTARELAEEAVKRKIVPSISTRTVGREAAPDPLLAASGAGGSGAV